MNSTIRGLLALVLVASLAACSGGGGGGGSAPPVDTAAPSTPTGLQAQAVSSSRVDITWNPCTDNTAVTGYEVIRAFATVGTTPLPSFSETNLQAGTTYCYQVRARDANGNWSGLCAEVCATTLAPPDLAAPQVLAMAPAMGAVGVPVSSLVTATFSEAVDPATLAGAFTLAHSGSPLAGSVAWDLPTLTATFTPAAPLPWLTVVTCTIGTSLTDLAGNPVSGNVSWAFTTAVSPPLFQQAATVSLGYAAEDLALADLDGDGILDLVTVGHSQLCTNLGLGTGGFGAARTLAFPAPLRFLAVGDLNGDFAPEVLTLDDNWNGSYPPGVVRTFLNDGHGGLTASASASVGPFPVQIVLADLDGSGHPDLVTANHMGNSVSLLRGAGDGTFSSFSADPRPTFECNSVAVADLDGDGKLDIIPAGGPALRGDGAGGFTADYDFSPTSYLSFPWSVAVGDLDGDGHPDIVVGGDGTDHLVVWWGDGTTHPQVAMPLMVGYYPREVRIVDVNGDGRPDLIVTRTHNGGIGTIAVEVLLGLGGRTFTDPVVLLDYGSAWGGWAGKVAVGDLNGDGRVDLALLQPDKQTAAVLLNGSN